MTIPNWGVWELLVIVFGIIAVLVITIFGIKWLKVKVLPGGMKIGDEGKPYPPHSICPNVKDVLSVIAKTTELIEERTVSRYSLVEVQMKFFEELMVDLRGKMMKVMISGLAARLGVHDGVVDHPDYRQYLLISKHVKTTLGDYVRVAMRQNHLTELEGAEWTNYKAMKKKSLVQTITGILNDMWRGSLITREELYRMNMASTIVKDAEDAIERLFEYAREEGIKEGSRLLQMKESYEDFLELKILGEGYI